MLPLALSQSLADLPKADHGRVDLPVSPLLKMRRWFRVSWQYVSEYRKGTACDAVVQAVAQQRSPSHRDMSARRARPAEAAMERAALTGLSRRTVVRLPAACVVVSQRIQV